MAARHALDENEYAHPNIVVSKTQFPSILVPDISASWCNTEVSARVLAGEVTPYCLSLL